MATNAKKSNENNHLPCTGLLQETNKKHFSGITNIPRVCLYRRYNLDNNKSIQNPTFNEFFSSLADYTCYTLYLTYIKRQEPLGGWGEVSMLTGKREITVNDNATNVFLRHTWSKECFSLQCHRYCFKATKSNYDGHSAAKKVGVAT